MRSMWTALMAVAILLSASPGGAKDAAPAGDEKKLLFWAEADPEIGPAPLAVKFSVDLMEVKGENIPNPKYSWDFGDGSAPSREKDPTHTYAKPGDYEVRVRVTDDEGKSGIFDLQITVDEPEAAPAKAE